jgi:hypothetical protein
MLAVAVTLLNFYQTTRHRTTRGTTPQLFIVDCWVSLNLLHVSLSWHRTTRSTTPQLFIVDCWVSLNLLHVSLSWHLNDQARAQNPFLWPDASTQQILIDTFNYQAGGGWGREHKQNNVGLRGTEDRWVQRAGGYKGQAGTKGRRVQRTGGYRGQAGTKGRRVQLHTIPKICVW